MCVPGAVALRGAHFGPGEGEILVDDLECVGNESTLLECSYTTPFCFHFEDAGVICPGMCTYIYIATTYFIIQMCVR